MKIIENQSFDEERSLYGSREITVKRCSFDGPADGESAFKECSDILVEDCFFNLRYPFWHDHNLTIRGSEMTELCPCIPLVFQPHHYHGHENARYQGTTRVL